jgi:hypothetical protein
VLLGTPLHASLSPHLLNVIVQIANKLGLQKKIHLTSAKIKPLIISDVCMYIYIYI